jgi:hypothetical protein
VFEKQAIGVGSEHGERQFPISVVPNRHATPRRESSAVWWDDMVVGDGMWARAAETDDQRERERESTKPERVEKQQKQGVEVRPKVEAATGAQGLAARPRVDQYLAARRPAVAARKAGEHVWVKDDAGAVVGPRGLFDQSVGFDRTNPRVLLLIPLLSPGILPLATFRNRPPIWPAHCEVIDTRHVS